MALNNLQRLICHKAQPNQINPAYRQYSWKFVTDYLLTKQAEIQKNFHLDIRLYFPVYKILSFFLFRHNL